MTKQLSSPQTMPTILHELNLGKHTLCIMTDGSIDLSEDHGHMPSLVDNGMSLDHIEAYRLFISLQEQFQPYGRRQEFQEPSHNNDHAKREKAKSSRMRRHRTKAEVITAQ